MEIGVISKETTRLYYELEKGPSQDAKNHNKRRRKARYGLAYAVADEGLFFEAGLAHFLRW